MTAERGAFLEARLARARAWSESLDDAGARRFLATTEEWLRHSATQVAERREEIARATREAKFFEDEVAGLIAASARAGGDGGGGGGGGGDDDGDDGAAAASSCGSLSRPNATSAPPWPLRGPARACARARARRRGLTCRRPARLEW